MTHAIWSPLVLAAEAGLVTVGGRLVFATDTHRRAVERHYLPEVARLVTDAGYPAESMRLNRFLVELYRTRTDDIARRRLPAALVNHAVALMAQGQVRDAQMALQEAIDLARPVGNVAVLQAALGNLAVCWRDSGHLDGALSVFSEVEAICRRLDDAFGLQAVLGNRAQVVRQRGDHPGALAAMCEQEELCRSIGDAVGLACALAAQGALLSDTGHSGLALERFVAFMIVAEETGDLHGVAEASINEVDALRQLGLRIDAETRAVEAEALIGRISDEPLLARILDARARSAIDEGRWADARTLSTKTVLTARVSVTRPALLLALGMLGSARRELGDVDGAAVAHSEEETLALELGDRAATSVARCNLAAIDIVRG